jgi:hypothetical protein
MLSGSTKICDWDKTEKNREHVERFLLNLIESQALFNLSEWIHTKLFEERSTWMPLSEKVDQISLLRVHRLLAEGNFVLAVLEGTQQGRTLSSYDLFRLENGKIVEHWDTIEEVPPASEWKNNHGKF